jgi:hypothetical protein
LYVLPNIIRFFVFTFVQMNIVLVMVLFGMFNVRVFKRKSFLLFMVVAASFFLFSLLYSIADIVVYYAPVYIFMAILASLGLDYLVRRFVKRGRNIVFAAVLLVVFSINLVAFLPVMFQHDDDASLRYAEAVLPEVEPGSYLFTPVDEPLSSTAANVLFYFIYAEKRKDVFLISSAHLVSDWYKQNLEGRGLVVSRPGFAPDEFSKVTKDDEFAYYKERQILQIIKDNPDKTFYRISGTFDEPVVEKVAVEKGP